MNSVKLMKESQIDFIGSGKPKLLNYTAVKSLLFLKALHLSGTTPF